MFGGCGLGAAIAALEGTTDRPVVWATAQYLSFAKVGSVVDIDVTIAVDGRATTQARAVAHVGGTEIITVNAAMGMRDDKVESAHGTPPTVQPPDACPVRERQSEVTDALDSRIEQRWALAPGQREIGPIAPGRVAVWTRMPELLEPSGASLAVLGDYVPLGISITEDGDKSSTSLDNTLRVLNIVQSEWFLLDIRVHGIRNGFGHGDIQIWSEDGTLCAIGSQSCIVRDRGPVDEPRPPRHVA
jgi:acyl-CoA thioesterase-2